MFGLLKFKINKLNCMSLREETDGVEECSEL
jgi:hypothetical protein